MADEHRGLANTHYPGIRIAPKSDGAAFDRNAQWRLEAQIACLGEPQQKALLESSVFIIGATPLGVAIARKLLAFGFGRVGLFGDEFLAGAHGFAPPAPGPATDEQPTVLSAAASWASAEAPWATFERFRAASIDRSIEDMARGFKSIVSAVGPREAGQAVTLARSFGQPTIASQVAGRAAWGAAIPAGGACEKCLRVPELSTSEAAGLYFPLLDHVACWVATIAAEAALGHAPATAFVESIDASRSPWARQTTPVQSCCGPQT